jgi:hypothetical protein
MPVTSAAPSVASPSTNFTGTLNYTPTDVFLNLTANLGGGVTGLNINQRNVARAINTYFNGGGVLPAGFASAFGLNPDAI